MKHTSIKVSNGGRLVIPVAYRKALGIEDGTSLTLSLEDGTLHLSTIPEGIRRAQALIAKYVPAGVSLVDELIADRRAEALAESE
jgi:bifunctional DNA-binding transcriptional regulator/antitoxin component of YhaV-PrlF toxin-antitoxin module